MKNAKNVLALLIAIMLLSLCACGGSEAPASSFEGQSLPEYAEQLEKADNSEAAAAVYELIAQGGGAELIEKAHDEFPILSAADELGQFEAVFSHLKGGDGK